MHTSGSSSSDCGLVLLHRLECCRRRRQHQTAVALVVAVKKDVDERPVRADPVHGGVAKVGVRDAEDEFVDEGGVAVEVVLWAGVSMWAC